MKWWNVELINQPCFVMWISFFCHFKQSKKSPSASEHPVDDNCNNNDQQILFHDPVCGIINL